MDHKKNIRKDIIKFYIGPYDNNKKLNKPFFIKKDSAIIIPPINIISKL